MDPTLMAQQQALVQMLRSNPELIKSLTEASTVDPAQKMLEQRLQMAHQQRMQANGLHSYGAGAGIGNGLASLFGAVNEKQLEKEQGGLLGTQQHAVGEGYQALGGGQPPQGPQQSAMDPAANMQQAALAHVLARRDSSLSLPDQQSMIGDPGQALEGIHGAGLSTYGAPDPTSMQGPKPLKPLAAMNPLDIERLLGGT